MQAHILSLHAPSTPLVRSKDHFFSESTVSCCLSNSRELSVEHHASALSVPTHNLDRWSKHFISESGMVHIKLKRKKYRQTYKKKTLTLHTLLTLG